MHRIRTLRRLLVASFAAALIAAAATPTAQANGFSTIECAHAKFKQVDPLLNHDHSNPDAPSGHMHEFFCNDSVTASSTVESLAQGGTTARVPSDINALWAPALIKDGELIPGKVQYRLINASDPDEAPATVPPEGLSFIWGDVNRKKLPTSGQKMWECLGGPAGTYQLTFGLPQTCAGTTIRATTYNGAGCWDASKGVGGGLGREGYEQKAHFQWLDLDCDAPYTKVPRVSVIFLYPAEAAGGYFVSDDQDKDGDGPGDGEVGDVDSEASASFHLDFVYMNGRDGQDRGFYERLNEVCLNPLPGNNVALPGGGYPKGVCLDHATNGTLRLLSPATEVLDGGRTLPVTEPPASALPLLAYDHSTAAVHWYGLTPVSPNPPWVPIASPARVEATPCDVFEQPLDFLSKSGKYTWTDDPAERSTLLASGWAFGGTKACTVPTTAPASVPLCRLTMPDGDRILTTDPAEHADLVAAGGTAKVLGNVYPAS